MSLEFESAAGLAQCPSVGPSSRPPLCHLPPQPAPFIQAEQATMKWPEHLSPLQWFALLSWITTFFSYCGPMMHFAHPIIPTRLPSRSAGKLNILQHKSWNVWNRDNIEKVRSDLLTFKSECLKLASSRNSHSPPQQANTTMANHPAYISFSCR